MTVEIELTGNICSKLNTSGSSEPGAHYTPTHHARISAGESINYHMVVFVAPGT